jgi:hypothetical protein
LTTRPHERDNPHMRATVGIAALALAVTVAAGSASARTSSSGMQLACGPHGGATLSNIPEQASRFQFAILLATLRHSARPHGPYIELVRLDHHLRIIRRRAQYGHIILPARDHEITTAELSDGSTPGHGRFSLTKTDIIAVRVTATIKLRNHAVHLSATCPNTFGIQIHTIGS